ncbi:MAG: hypothetical protein WBB82_04255 [Limnothrix sp.]
MVNNFKYDHDNMTTPVIFRKDFRNATISATQAWSLFFSAGQEENLFGKEREIGWFYNNTLTAFCVTFALAAICFSAPLSPLF